MCKIIDLHERNPLMRARAELLSALGDQPDGSAEENPKSRKRGNRRQKARGAPAAVINGDSHQTFIVEGDLTIVFGAKEAGAD